MSLTTWHRLLSHRGVRICLPLNKQAGLIGRSEIGNAGGVSFHYCSCYLAASSPWEKFVFPSFSLSPIYSLVSTLPDILFFPFFYLTPFLKPCRDGEILMITALASGDSNQNNVRVRGGQ